MSNEAVKLISMCRRAGISLSVCDGQLHFQCPAGAMTAEIRNRLTAHKTALIELLSAGEHTHTTQVSVAEWAASDLLLVDWFIQSRSNLTTEPYRISSWAFMASPLTFYASLATDITQGPMSPRGRSGALMDDLAQLRCISARQGQPR